jgi:hypothetical protein
MSSLRALVFQGVAAFCRREWGEGVVSGNVPYLRFRSEATS